MSFKNYYLMLLTGLVLAVGCENANESKYRSSKKTNTSQTGNFLCGQQAYFSFEDQLNGIDSAGKAVAIQYVGKGLLTNKGSNTASKKSLYLQGSEYLQFNIPDKDTVSYTLFIKSAKAIGSSSPILLDCNNKADLGLDGVTGETRITVNGTLQDKAFNSYEQWSFVYVEIPRNASKVKVIIKYIFESNTETAIFNIDLSKAFSPGELLKIGASSDPSKTSFTGYVDELRTFNRALTSDEIESLSQLEE